MSINKKYVMAGVLATALVAPLTDATNSYADDTRTITGRVNFRTGPGKSYSSMGKIEKGKRVTYLGSSGNWIKIKYNSKTGYIYKDYISKATTSTSSSTSTSVRYVKSSDGLNVRKGPSVSYSKITNLPNGTKVTVKSTSNGWSKITSGSITGYVSDKYLSKTPPTVTVEENTSNDKNNQTNETSTTKYISASSGLNVRKGPSTSYSVISTLAKGTKVTVKSTSNGWSKITSGSITGYVNSSYLTSKKPSTATSSSTSSNSSSSNTNSSTSTSNSASKVISYAKKLLGKPYVWGAQGPNGFDCSGFTYYVFKNSAGITLPRTSSAQSKYGKAVSKSNLKPGDLLFFDTVGPNNGAVTHVGLYIGNGQFIHAASGQGKVVINNLNSSYYVKAYVNARRVL